MQKDLRFDNVVIVYVEGSGYRIHFWYMSKDDAINIINGSNLTDKNGFIKKIYYKFFVIYKNE